MISNGRYILHLEDIAATERRKLAPNQLQWNRYRLMRAEVAEFEAATDQEDIDMCRRVAARYIQKEIRYELSWKKKYFIPDDEPGWWELA